MDIKEIDALRKKIETINKNINEKKANVKVLKEQLTKKVQELRGFGVNTLDEAESKIKELETEYDTLKAKIEKAASHAEEQLAVKDEII